MFPVAVAQLNSTDHVETNLKQILELIAVAAAKNPKPKVVFFPENSLYFRINSSDSVQAINMSDTSINQISVLANQLNIYVHLTTAMEQNGKTFNSSVLFSPNENPRIIYNKIHLFDVFIPGQQPIAESKVFTAGDSAQTFTLENILFGSSICYDIRFSELYSAYARKNVHVLVVPSAFLVKTGQAHWMTLLKARAIESQCFVIASAQSGKHESIKFPGEFRETFGHSVVFDPWGDQLALKESGVGVITAELDLSRWESVRTAIPMPTHRRL